MSSNKLGLLSMCRKAGRMVVGMDMVKDACANGNAKAVFTASDFSERSLKEIRFACARNGVRLYALGVDMDSLGQCIGKRSGVIAMTDSGFAKSCAKGLEEIEADPAEFGLL